MIKSDLMLCAQGVVRDAQTSTISVFNIMEEITPEGLPVLVQQFMVYARLLRDIENDPSTIECNLKMAIGDKILFEHVVNVSFQDKARNQMIINIAGLVIPIIGDLETSLWYSDNMINQYVVTIKEPRQPKVTPHTS